MITKEGNELIMKIPLKQMDYDAIGDEIGLVDNLVGYSDGKDFSINHLCALGYKDDIQLGMPIIVFEDKETLKVECEKLGLDIWEYNRCSSCKEPLLGSFTMSDKGDICFSCNKNA